MLCAELANAGLTLDAELVHSAALLHDLARRQPDHPAIGALWLRELGYAQAAEIVRQHHDLDCLALNEAALVFLADKAIQGAEPVGLEARFARSREKCGTSDALSAHQKRYEAACSVREQIRTLCGKAIL